MGIKQILFSLLVAVPLFSSDAKFPWVVYYSNKAPSADFDPYNPIIFDDEVHPSLPPILAQDKEVLGYIDLAEAEERRWYYKKVKEWGILIQENADWPGSWAVDIRNPKWKELILKEIIPSILKQGFNGLFYDQLDISIALEKENPEKYAGMIDAAIDLVKSIHETFPQVRKMMNRAYEIIPDVGNSIDYVLGEDLYSGFDFKTKQYRVRPPEEYKWGLSQLNKGRKKFPHLVLFSLDYWSPEDTKMYKQIYELERSHCIRPYVATLLLDKIIPEPK